MEKLKDIYELIKYWFTERKVLVIMVLSIIVIIMLGVFLLLKNTNSNKREEFSLLRKESIDYVESDYEKNNGLCKVSVDIKGEVNMPGYYQVDCDKRVQDVIELAGGITNEADTSVLNLSKKVFDEMVVIVYSKKEVANFIEVKKEESISIDECLNHQELKNDGCIEDNSLDSSVDSSVDNSIKQEQKKEENEEVNAIMISINKALVSELIKLPGIGESKANKIIEYRNEHGPFQSIEELKNISGIGEKIFDKIKPYITL